MAARFEQGGQITYSCLGHASILVGGTAVGLPSLPDLSRLRRAVIRNLGQPIDWRNDGADPDGSTDFRALADEIVVFDGEFDKVRMKQAPGASGAADTRVIYFGT